ncbi:hypothetical protein ANCDUO_26668, partial [Ancylostoma duodenale]
WKPILPADIGSIRWPVKTQNETRTAIGCPGCPPETRSSRDVGGRSALTRDDMRHPRKPRVELELG